MDVGRRLIYHGVGGRSDRGRFRGAITCLGSESMGCVFPYSRWYLREHYSSDRGRRRGHCVMRKANRQRAHVICVRREFRRPNLERPRYGKCGGPCRSVRGRTICGRFSCVLVVFVALIVQCVPLDNCSRDVSSRARRNRGPSGRQVGAVI